MQVETLRSLSCGHSGRLLHELRVRLSFGTFLDVKPNGNAHRNIDWAYAFGRRFHDDLRGVITEATSEHFEVRGEDVFIDASKYRFRMCRHLRGDDAHLGPSTSKSDGKSRRPSPRSTRYGGRRARELRHSALFGFEHGSGCHRAISGHIRVADFVFTSHESYVRPERLFTRFTREHRRLTLRSAPLSYRTSDRHFHRIVRVKT